MARKKSLLEKHKDKLKQDHTKRNVKALKKLSSMKVEGKLANDLLNRINGNGRSEPAARPDPAEGKSVFTEDDFRKFVKRYLVE